MPFRVSHTTYSSSYPSSSGSPVFGSQSLTKYFMVQLNVQDTGGKKRHFRCRKELPISERPDRAVRFVFPSGSTTKTIVRHLCRQLVHIYCKIILNAGLNS